MIRLPYSILFLMWSFQSCFGQNALSFYHQKNNTQKIQLNPALYFEYEPNAHLDVLNININEKSNFLYSDLIEKGTGLYADSLVLNIPKFKNALDSHNFLAVQSDLTLFNFGFRSGPRTQLYRNRTFPHYFSFGLRQRFTNHFLFNKNYIELLTQGNAPFYTEKFQTGQLGINSSSYTEWSLGYGRKLSDRLWVGVRLKYLQGLYNVSTEQFSLTLEGATFENYIDVAAQANIRVSGPFTLGLDEFNTLNSVEVTLPEFALLTTNPGYAFDVGVVYELFPQLFISASITDVGGIRWNNKVQRIELDTTYRYEAIDFSNSYDDELENYRAPEDLLDEFTNEIRNAFSMNEINTSYSTTLPYISYVGVNYKFIPEVDFSMVYQSIHTEIISQNTLSLSANIALLDVLSFSPQYLNVEGNEVWGFSAGFRLGAAQFYMAVQDLKGWINPAHAYAIQFQIGSTISFRNPFLTKK